MSKFLHYDAAADDDDDDNYTVPRRFLRKQPSKNYIFQNYFENPTWYKALDTVDYISSDCFMLVHEFSF